MRRPSWFTRTLRPENARAEAALMEIESRRFYEAAAQRTSDAGIRQLVDDAVTVFILPPSFHLLRKRLVARGTDSPADLERRLRGAPGEVEQYKYFQYVILNDDINRASAQLASVIDAERARRERQDARLKETLADFASCHRAMSDKL